MITYRRKRPGETVWRVIPVTAAEPPAGVRRLPRPIDQMTNVELKAEYQRRLPCCGKTER